VRLLICLVTTTSAQDSLHLGRYPDLDGREGQGVARGCRGPV